MTFTLDGSDPDGSVASWSLDFGGGQSTSGTGDPDGLQRTHTYSAGTWSARLTLTDDRGATASVTASVTANAGSNAAPTASLTASPARGEAPLVAQLLPSAHDSDGSVASWELDFGDGARATGTGDPSGLALARPAIEGSVNLDGERASVALRLDGPDGLPFAGAEVRLEDARATTDARGRATLDVEARKLADGFTVQAGTPPIAWRFQPAVGKDALAWEVEVRPGGLDARLRGTALPDRLAMVARWLGAGEATEGALEAERFGDALRVASKFPVNAQEVELRVPSWAGTLALGGGGSSGQLARLEPATFRASLRPAFATLSLTGAAPSGGGPSGIQPLAKQLEGLSWEVSIANRAKAPVRSVHWELLSAARANLAQGDVAPSDPRAETVQFRLRLPDGEPAAFLRLTVAFEGGLTAVLPEEALAAASSRVPAAVARTPEPGAFGALALLGAALLLGRRR